MSGPQSAKVDIARLFDSGEWGTLPKVAFIIGCLAYGVDGLANQILGAAIPAMVESWHVSREAFGHVAAAGLIGMAVGTVVFGVVGDLWGRRPALIGSVGLFAFASMGIAAVDTIYPFVVLRFISGLGLGGALPSATTIIADMTPLRRRSLAISAAGVFIGLGGLSAGLLAAGILPTLGWRALFVIAGAISAIVAGFAAILMPESPRYLVRHPARRELLLSILRRSGHAAEDNAEFVDTANPPQKVNVGTLLGANYRRDTIGLWILIFFCMLAAYSVLTWIPTMLRGQGFSLAEGSLGFTGWSVGAISAAFVVAALLQWTGSRVTFLVITGGAAIGAILLGLRPPTPSDGVVVMMVALGLESVFLTGTQTAFYALAAYVYPPAVRNTGVGIATMWGRLGAMTSSYAGVYALDKGGAIGYFAVVGGSAVIAFFAVFIVRRHSPSGARS